MSSDLVYSAILAVVLLFLGLWALILAIGFFLSWRDDVNEAKKAVDDPCQRPSRKDKGLACARYTRGKGTVF